MHSQLLSHILPSFLLFLSSLEITAALHASEAGLIDWHKPLIGIPLSSSSPQFVVAPTSDPLTSPGVGLVDGIIRDVGLGNDKQEVAEGGKVERKLVITASEAGVLSALDTQTGEIGEYFVF